MRRELRIQPLRTDRWRILVANAVRDECLILNTQREFSIAARFSHVECIFPRKIFHLKPYVLHNGSAAHFIPAAAVADAGAIAAVLFRKIDPLLLSSEDSSIEFRI